jgi:hypothetical protein
MGGIQLNRLVGRKVEALEDVRTVAKHPLARLIPWVAVVVGLSMLIRVSPAAAQVSDCSDLNRGSAAFGLCKAYCEALACSTPEPKNQEACVRIFDAFLKNAGTVPPCFTCPVPNPNVVCTLEFAPVTCGGCVYTNQCNANAAGFAPGQCERILP